MSVAAYAWFKKAFRSPAFHLAIVCFLSGLLLFGKLHLGSLDGYDDAIFAHESREMIKTGDWGTIRANGVVRFDYFPLYYWMQAASMEVFGISDFAVRFPSALCGWLLIILVFFFSRQITADPIVPIVAAWILLLTPDFMRYSKHAMSDVPFALLFSLALFVYVKGLTKPRLLILCGLVIGAAIMTRSILGIIPAAIIIFHAIFSGRPAILRSKEFLLGGLISIALPTIWCVYSYAIHGQAFTEAHSSFLWEKITVGQGFNPQGFLPGLLQYPRLLITGYERWILLAIFGLAMQVKRAVKERNSDAILLVLWVGFVLVPFSLVSAKTIRYIMAVFPALAILAAVPLAAWLPKLFRPRFRLVPLLALCMLVILGFVFSSPADHAHGARTIAPAIVVASEPSKRVILYTAGEMKWDIQCQLSWYTDRYFEHLTNLDLLLEKASLGGDEIFVVDRQTYDAHILAFASRIQVFGQTEEFVCFSITRP